MTEFPYQRVRLIADTKPEPAAIDWPFDHDPVGEDLIAYTARVSNPGNQNNWDTAPRLLRYCISKKHWSVFEMASVVLEIETTRDIGRQILRHRSFSFQEFSQRYAKVEEGSFTLREARLQDTKNRQNSIETIDDALKAWWQEVQQDHVEHAIRDYNEALNRGIAKEVARAILPEGLTMSRMYLHGTLRSWFHYCSVRNDPGVTQKEHVDIAAKCWDVLRTKFQFLNDVEGN